MVDSLHLADWSLGCLELIEDHLALLVRLLANDELINASLCGPYAGLYGL